MYFMKTSGHAEVILYIRCLEFVILIQNSEGWWLTDRTVSLQQKGPTFEPNLTPTDTFGLLESKNSRSCCSCGPIKMRLRGHLAKEEYLKIDMWTIVAIKILRSDANSIKDGK